MSAPILATVLDTPAGDLSLLAHDGTLVAAGFTGDQPGPTMCPGCSTVHGMVPPRDALRSSSSIAAFCVP